MVKAKGSAIGVNGVHVGASLGGTLLVSRWLHKASHLVQIAGGCWAKSGHKAFVYLATDFVREAWMQYVTLTCDIMRNTWRRWRVAERANDNQQQQRKPAY